MNNNTFTQLILDSYYDEIGAYNIYRYLADLAPTEEARRIYITNSQDEFSHAQQFKKIYNELTGNEPPENEENNEEENLQSMSYRDILRMQINDEHVDFRKYKDMYLMTNNPIYRDILFNAAYDELLHSMLDTYLL